MRIFDEFKKFAMRGNVVDLAIGVVIGAAFTGIVNSLVKDVIMPPIGLALGGIDFANFFITLKGPHLATLAEAQKAAAVTLNYGAFINTIINFLIVALALSHRCNRYCRGCYTRCCRRIIKQPSDGTGADGILSGASEEFAGRRSGCEAAGEIWTVYFAWAQQAAGGQRCGGGALRKSQSGFTADDGRRPVLAEFRRHLIL